jgi:LacI family transcriptional regulator
MPPRKKNTVTLGQIAETAGVSRATASRALKDNPVISKPVRQRIQKLARKLGYRPDPEATRLMSYLKKSGQTRFESVIGLLNAYDSLDQLRESRYTANLIAGAESRARELGYSIDYLHMGIEGMTPRRMDQIIATRGIRGVLIPPEPDPLFNTELNWSKISAVATTTTARPLNLHRVLPHNFHNIGLIFESLLERGYGRIGVILWDRLEERQMQAAGSIYGLYAHIRKRIPPLKPFEWQWLDPEERKDERMRRWIEREKPEVVVGFGDACTQVITRATGMKIPADIGFISYGDCPRSMSRLDQNPRDVGAAAVDMLSAHIQRGDTGLPETPKTTLIEGHLIEGDTLPKTFKPPTSK